MKNKLFILSLLLFFGIFNLALCQENLTATETQKKRKSHDMSVESGKHGKSHNLINDAFFYIPEGVEPEDGLMHTENTGSAKVLQGKICVFTFFVSQNRWEDDLFHDTYKKNLAIAEDWLVRQAAKYGSKISFENRYPLGDTPITIKNIFDTEEGNNKDPYEMVMNSIKSMEITSGELIQMLSNETDCENIVTNFYVDKDGRSFCYLGYKGARKEEFLDFTWLYKTSRNEIELPGTIAHEILHAFGAFDLYERDNYGKEQSDRVGKKYPNEIMYTGDYANMDKLHISPITAWKVGIGKKTKDLEFYVPDGWCND